MTIYLAADHAGFDAKENLKAFLLNAGHDVQDCGAFSLDMRDDYPDVVSPCVAKVASHEGSFGIILGASGQGEAMVANRRGGIRAAVYYGPASGAQEDASGTELSLIASARMHNDANVLSLGARFLSLEDMYAAVTEFLATPFSNDERHIVRLAKF